jgi:hypothetical protein
MDRHVASRMLESNNSTQTHAREAILKLKPACASMPSTKKTSTGASNRSDCSYILESCASSTPCKGVSLSTLLAPTCSEVRGVFGSWIKLNGAGTLSLNFGSTRYLVDAIYNRDARFDLLSLHKLALLGLKGEWDENKDRVTLREG